MLAETMDLDRIQSLGFLARAGIALTNGEANPASRPKLPDELSRRTHLIERLRQKAKSALSTSSEEAIDAMVSAWIDDELNSLEGDFAADEAIRRLSARGALPGDAYKIVLDPYFVGIMSKYAWDDGALAIQTVHHPDHETHFETMLGGDDSAGSVFGKWFGNEVGGDEPFFHIVSGLRKHGVLKLNFWFRLYPSDVTFMHLSDMGDALRRFSDVFGCEYSINQWRGRFARSEFLPGRPSGLVSQKLGRSKHAAFFVTLQGDDRGVALILGVGVDLTEYAKSIGRHRMRGRR